MVDGYEPSGLTPDELAALPPYEKIAGMSFVQIEAIYGEEIAINVGIATDPDCWVPTDEEWAQAKPFAEMFPEFVGAGVIRGPAKEHCNIPLDHDLLDHFRQAGPDWHTRLNDTLRQAVFGSATEGVETAATTTPAATAEAA